MQGNGAAKGTVSLPLTPGRILAGTNAVVVPVPVNSLAAAINAVPPGGLKRKLKDAPEVCWDLVKKGSCPRGAACKWSHDVDPNTFDLTAPAPKKQKTQQGQQQQQGSGVKGRTDEDRAKAKAEYATWRDERVVMGADPQGLHCQSLDWWYAQVCLVCLAECDLTIFEGHRKSTKHTAKYKEIGGLSLFPGIIRPEPRLKNPLEPANMEKFLSVAGFGKSRVLVLGEQDYSFSLAVAQRQYAEMGRTDLVATSYLAEHDPSEPEVHVRDDGLRSSYSRRSLPSMDGALEKNIAEIKSLGGTALHSVDATDLLQTLVMQKPDGIYDVIVFPFPRASLRRGVDPMNPRLLRLFFRSVAENTVLAPGGVIELLLLRTQYPDWDTANLALEHGFRLLRHTALPEGFYQSREMSGKTWTPKDAEIYVFGRA